MLRAVSSSSTPLGQLKESVVMHSDDNQNFPLRSSDSHAPFFAVPWRLKVPLKENDLVEALYDAALGQRPWAEVTRSLMDHMAGMTLMLSVLNSRSQAVEVVATQGMSVQHLRDYGHFAPHDLWVSGFMKQRLFGRALAGSQFVDERVLMNSYIYNEYLRPKMDVHYIAGSVVQLDGGCIGVIGTYRPHDAHDFSRGEAKRLERLLPHLQRALQIRQRLQQAEQTSRSVHSVLDRLSLGVIILGATGKLLHANTAADAILRGADGLIRTPTGLRAGRKEDDRRLQELIAGLRQSSEPGSAGGHLRVHRPSGQPAYAVMLTPAAPSIAGRGKEAPAVLVFVSDPGGRFVSDLKVLTELFGFPPAEGRLVMALLSGMSAPDFARKAGVTHNTVRTLLARAMARTDSRSQLEMVLLVAGTIGMTSSPKHPAGG